MTATVPWLSIDLYPDDNADRMLRLPDGREVIGSRRRNLLGTPNGWQTKTPHEFDEPIYEEPLRGGFMIDARKRGAVEPERKQVGTRKAVMWIVGDLPDDMAPTHYRPNDTILGDPKSGLS